MSLQNYSTALAAVHQKSSLEDDAKAFKAEYNAYLTAKDRSDNYYKLAEKEQEKATAHRVSSAKMLLALRQRVESEGLSWWSWFETHVKIKGFSRSNAEKLLAIAKAEDPTTAHDVEKEQTRARVRNLRAERRAAAASAIITQGDTAALPGSAAPLALPPPASAVHGDVRRNGNGRTTSRASNSIQDTPADGCDYLYTDAAGNALDPPEPLKSDDFIARNDKGEDVAYLMIEDDGSLRVYDLDGELLLKFERSGPR